MYVWSKITCNSVTKVLDIAACISVWKSNTNRGFQKQEVGR